MDKIAQIITILNQQKSTGAKESVYFVGIGGIGMSALARYFLSLGFKVNGYDKTETTLTKQLIAEGATIHYNDTVEAIDNNAAFVVYTPAIPATHVGLNFIKSNNFILAKRSDVLGAITGSAFNICVAGTHGKTTTSTMVAHLLRYSNFGCNAFLGGISVNYNSNFWSSTNNTCVVEADEYDRSFLKLTPSIAVITAMDADHLDIYGSAEEVTNAFISFSQKIQPNGILFYKYGMPAANQLQSVNKFSYHLNNSQADIFTTDLKVVNGSYYFNIVTKNWQIQNITLHMGGLHNVENMLAAIAIAKSIEISDEKIIAAVKTFAGVKRRFEYIVKNDTTVFIDDYAHHPDELNALLDGVKSIFGEKKCTLIFQPHLFSRTNDFAAAFAKALDRADEIILLPIYPARELPMVGVTSEMLANLMQNKNVKIIDKEAVVNYIVTTNFEVLVTAGAGDIDTLVPQLKKAITP
jgi:UDP-N-acetylmuramate--alanine ligase